MFNCSCEGANQLRSTHLDKFDRITEAMLELAQRRVRGLQRRRCMRDDVLSLC